MEAEFRGSHGKFASCGCLGDHLLAWRVGNSRCTPICTPPASVGLRTTGTAICEDAITVRVTARGYYARATQPSSDFGPGNAAGMAIIGSLPRAIASEPLMSARRRRFSSSDFPTNKVRSRGRPPHSAGELLGVSGTVVRHPHYFAAVLLFDEAKELFQGHREPGREHFQRAQRRNCIAMLDATHERGRIRPRQFALSESSGEAGGTEHQAHSNPKWQLNACNCGHY